MTPIQPAMTAALACAPLIPPRPDERKTLPVRSLRERYFRPAFIMVSCKVHKTKMDYGEFSSRVSYMYIELVLSQIDGGPDTIGYNINYYREIILEYTVVSE